MVLAPLFSDLESEPYSKKLGFVQPRADLTIPSLRLIIEAKFARAIDRAQPILQNLYTAGISWRQHGVRAADVRARNRTVIEEGAPALWAHLEALLADAVRDGTLAE